MTPITKEERDALNALAVNGQLAAARCVERLLTDGNTVLTVLVAGTGVRIEIVAPRRASPLWTEAATCRITQAEVTLVAVRFGCEIRWTISRAEAELMRIAELARRIH